MDTETRKLLDQSKKAIHDAREIVRLAKKKNQTRSGKGLTKDVVKQIVTEALADMQGAIGLRKGEFDTGDNLTVDDAGNLDSYRYTMLQKSENSTIKELQKFNDDLLIIGAVLSKGGKNGSIKDNILNTKMYQRYIKHKGVSELQKAIDGTTGKGLEWIPTMFSSDLIEKVKVELKVAALFGRINMPSNPYTLPVEGADAIGYLVSNTTSDDIRDANAMPLASTPGTAKTTFDASKLGARTVFNEETSEDSIIGVMDYTKMKVVEAIARAIENATCNGSRSATHPDNDVQTDPNSSKLSARAWDGFRQCIQDAGTWSSGASFNTAAIRAARKLMGKYGINVADAVIICSVNVWYNFLNSSNFPELQTLDKYGPNALILTGEVGKIDGVSIIASEFQRDDVSATGFNTVGGPNTKSSLVIVNRKSFLYGDRREMTTDSERNIETDKTVVVSKVRQDFRRLYANTETTIAGLNNITP
jgi:HK97 family phage major capsid protein